MSCNFLVHGDVVMPSCIVICEL